MQIETLKQAGAIYLEQIQEGFDQCDWVEFTLDAGEAVDKLSAEWEACGKENAWADFYYFTLPDEAKERGKQVPKRAGSGGRRHHFSAGGTASEAACEAE